MTLPSLIGQYRIVRKIGAGGMGLVYLGEHTLLGRRAAVKTLLPTVAANHEIVERFFNEARATSAIADPGVIQIFDFGYHVDGTAYIVMELLEGEALSARLDRVGRLTIADALRFARQIAGSLAAAHAKGIVHRDLKPENIFLVRDAEAQGGERTKIIDFGICKVGSGDPTLTEVGAMIGTPVYMSPEQCRGAGDVDHRSDIYAFGCLLFHMLTGRPPFIGEASGELIVAHLQEEPPPPSQFSPGLPPAIDALVLRCLAKTADDRLGSMAELQTAIGELAVQPDVLSPAVPTPPRNLALGRGFRSVFDANMAAAMGKSLFGNHTPRGTWSGRPGTQSPVRLVPNRSTVTPPFARGPELRDPDSAEHTQDGLDEIELPRRRAGVRAALACVLVVGVALGLVVTPLIAGESDAPATPKSAQVAPSALPVESTVAAQPSRTARPAEVKPEPASAASGESHPAASQQAANDRDDAADRDNDGDGDGDGDHDTSTADARPTRVASASRSHAAREPRSKSTGSRTPHANGSSSPAASRPASSGPVTSPIASPSTPAPAPAEALTPTASARPASSAPASSSPSEDLYDTR